MDGPAQKDDGELNRQFTERLRKLTNRSGFSVRDLEKVTKLGKSTVHNALQGRHFPRLDTVVKIVDACGGDAEWWRGEWAEANEARRKTQDPSENQWQQPPPRQLPATVADFVGRSGELDILAEQLAKAMHGPSIVVITSIAGTAGVGKTALALSWGHQVSDQFSDGQLYVDLRGHGPSQPRYPGDALAQLLSTLGVPAERVPGDEDERAGLYRSLLAGKKMLVVLDNAASPDQVRPLLPGSPGCLVIVTSRSELPGLVAGNGARQIILDRLAPEEAVELLRLIVGRARVDAEPDAAAEIARRCALLPLALRVAAGRALASSHQPLTEIADQLAQHRLDLLTTSDNDQSMNVRAVFSWSYQALPTGPARLFRLLGLHTGPEINIPTAAALVEIPGPDAEELLEVLAGAHLLERTGESRYRFHDLLRDYAAEQAAADETEPEREAAVHRMLEMYLHTADAADRTLTPNRLRAPIDRPQTSSDLPTFTTYEQALAWFDLEHANLTAAASLAAVSGQHDIAWKIPATMSVYCYIRKPWTDWITSHEVGLTAARHCQEPFGEAAMLTGLGAARYELRQYQQAVNHLQLAHKLWRDIELLWGEAITLNILGSAHRDLRQFEQAITCFQRALDIWPEIEPTWGKGVTLHNLGTTYRDLGQTTKAISWLHEAITVRRTMPDQYGEAWALHDLGTIHAKLHEFDKAVDCLDQALTIRHEIGDRHGEAQTRYELGKTMRATGNPETATAHLRQALAIFDDLHDPRARDVKAYMENAVGSVFKQRP
jgi:tetratricopeptide (TPR) repeat protein